MKARVLSLSALMATLACALTPHLSASPATTTTAITMSSGGNAIRSGGSVASGSQVTLTATVSSGATQVLKGQVNFCDASVSYCTDIHLLGTAQLTVAGTATLSFHPGIGSHTYKAVFAGTPNGSPAYAASSSSSVSLTITGTLSTSTTIAATGGAGNYALTATVAGLDGGVAPNGTVSFLDASSSNFQVGSATLSGDQFALNWLNSQTPAVGKSPYAIVSADFNGDGLADLAIPNDGSATVTILLGKGDGTFAPAAVSPKTGLGPICIVVGDFNGDGIPDMAVGNEGSYSVTILLGNGDGSFTAAPSLNLGTGEPTSLAIADFNGDGVPDLLVDEGNFGTLAVFLGNGDGTFSAGTSVSVAYGTLLASGDFRGIGKQDLAVVSVDGANYLRILLGNGDGTFTLGSQYPLLYTNIFSVISADLNGDGRLDLAIADQGAVQILLGNGDGTFTPGTPLVPAYDSEQMGAGDFNGDGKVDLAVATGTDTGYSVVLFLGNGDGTFIKGATNPATGQCPYGVVAADFNGDGFPDIATQNYCDNDVTILISQPTRTATATASGIAPLGTGTHQAVASYPGDTNYSSSISTSTGVTALQAKPTVTITPIASGISTTQQVQVAVTVKGTTGDQTPTGTLTVSSGSYTSPSATLAGGTVTVTIPAGSLPTGSDTVTANYAGDTNYLAATSTPLSVNVTEATPTVTVTPASLSISAAKALSVTVGVSGGSGAAAPTGTVTLTGGGYTSAATALSGASATINIPAGSLATGADTLTVNYSGDSTYLAASGTASVTVFSPSFALTGTAVSVVPGSLTGNTSTISVTPSGGFIGSVSLTAVATSLPAGAVEIPTFSFGATIPVSITSTSAGTATLTITTTAPASACSSSNQRPGGIPGFAKGGVVLALAFFFAIPARRRSWRNVVGLLALLAAFSSGVLACGGGGGGGKSCSGPTSPGTTAGAYTITVTGASGSLTETGTITVTVQ